MYLYSTIGALQVIVMIILQIIMLSLMIMIPPRGARGAGPRAGAGARAAADTVRRDCYDDDDDYVFNIINHIIIMCMFRCVYVYVHCCLLLCVCL